MNLMGSEGWRNDITIREHVSEITENVWTLRKNIYFQLHIFSLRSMYGRWVHKKTFDIYYDVMLIFSFFLLTKCSSILKTRSRLGTFIEFSPSKKCGNRFKVLGYTTNHVITFESVSYENGLFGTQSLKTILISNTMNYKPFLPPVQPKRVCRMKFNFLEKM